MNNMEQNRQIVQDGLDKRANKRKKAIIEAEQEVITIQMFRIVNTNANNAEPKYQSVRNEVPVYKRPSKKLIRLRNVSAVNMVASFVALTIPVILYFTNLTEIPCMLATLALPALTLIYNLCIFAKAQKKLKRRK